MTLDAGNMNSIRVWVMRPGGTAAAGFVFPWSWGDWYEHKRLIATGYTKLPGAMGGATFKLERSTISDNNPKVKQPFTWDDATLPLVEQMYIAITVGDLRPTIGDTGESANILWWGFVSEIHGSQLAGTLELMGTVSALGVGHLLDRIPIRGWARNNIDGYPSSMSAPGSANLGSNIDGQVIGNAVIGESALGGADGRVYLFQNDPAKCSASASAYFTRWRLLTHVQLMCLQRAEILGGVNWALRCLDNSQAFDPAPATPATIASYLNDTTTPDVYETRNQTCKGMLDLLVPRNMGFGWDIVLTNVSGQVGWQIVIYTSSEGNTYGLPAFTAQAQTITLANHPTVDFQPLRQGLDVPDEIIVTGSSPILFGVTVGYPDGNYDQGWDSTPTTGQEALYRAAAGAGIGYSGLTTVQQLDRNRQIRQAPGLVDVFTRYQLKPGNGVGVGPASDLLRSTNPGRGAANLPMCPVVEWDGTNISFGTASRAPYLPTMHLSRTIPWVDGFSASGTDLRPAVAKAWPVYSGPRLFYYAPDAPAGSQWLDLLAKGGVRSTPSVEADDRGAAMKITYDKPERLGLGIIDLAADPAYDIAQDGTPTEGANIFNWKRVVATIGVPSDQRVSVTKRRPGVTKDSDVRTSLRIELEKLQCYIMHEQSIIGIDADGEPTFVNGFGPSKSVIFRNDFPLAEKICNRLAAFHFRRRQGFAYVGMRPDAPPTWAYIGCPVSKVIESTVGDNAAEVSATYNVVIEKIDVVLGDKPRITVHGELPSAPSFGSSPSPSSGGSISIAQNGTLAQAVAQVRQDVNALTKDGQRTPLVLPYSPGGGAIAPELYIAIGNNIIPACTSLGIQKRTDAILGSELPVGTGGAPGDIVTVPAVASPPTMPNGVGVGKQYGTNNYVWMILDSNSTYSSDIPNMKNVVGGAVINLDKISGGITYRYACHVAYRAW